MNSKNNPKFMFIIFGAIIVIGLVIVLLVQKPSAPEAVLAEGANYAIDNIAPGRYQIIDDTGNVIDLKRINSMDSTVFQDESGKKYIFVSGSPYKFEGMK